MIGIKVTRNKNSIKIYGNPSLNLEGRFAIKNFRKDHRVFMMSTIAALTLGGIWKIHDKDSVKTSLPNFINIIKQLGANLSEKREILSIAIDYCCGVGTQAKLIAKSIIYLSGYGKNISLDWQLLFKK